MLAQNCIGSKSTHYAEWTVTYCVINITDTSMYKQQHFSIVSKNIQQKHVKIKITISETGHHKLCLTIEHKYAATKYSRVVVLSVDFMLGRRWCEFPVGHIQGNTSRFTWCSAGLMSISDRPSQTPFKKVSECLTLQ